MKKKMALLLGLLFAMVLSFTAYAGEWEEKADGWYYRNDDGTYAKNTVIDGYYISYTGRMINEKYQDSKRGFNIAAQMMMSGTAQYYEEYGLYTFKVPYTTNSDHPYSTLVSELNGMGGVGNLIYKNDGRARTWDIDSAKSMFSAYVDFFNTKCLGVLELPIIDRYKALCDILANHMTYNENPNIYDAVCNGSGNCVAYAGIYKVICNMAGLDCDVVIAVGDHNWNIVKVNGVEYWIDPQYYDTEGGKGFMVPVGSGSLWDSKKERFAPLAGYEGN